MPESWNVLAEAEPGTDPSSASASLQEALESWVRDTQDLIEMMCIRSLLWGDRGVLVTYSGLQCRVELSLEVPCGEVHTRTVF